MSQATEVHEEKKFPNFAERLFVSYDGSNAV